MMLEKFAGKLWIETLNEFEREAALRPRVEYSYKSKKRNMLAKRTK